jgi:polysaccharide biosynthesis/export protein
MNTSRNTSLSAVLLLAAAAPCFGQGKPATQTANSVVAVASAAAPAPTTAAAPVDPKEYVIGESDLLHINVYKEAELSQNAIVRPDGMISLPLVNEVKVGGKTPLQVQQELAQSLKAYLVDPQVTVTVVDVRSKRVFVTGEVIHPDAYPLLTPTTVLQVVAKAGGPTPYANLKGIFVLRNVNGKQEKIPIPYKDVIKGKKPDRDIQLQSGDTVVIP